MWQLWSQGKSLSEIGRQLNKHAGSVFCYLQKFGGDKPSPLPNDWQGACAFTTQRKKYHEVYRLIYPFREIAKNLNRATSTISREISRNGGLSKYRAVEPINVLG